MRAYNIITLNNHTGMAKNIPQCLVRIYNFRVYDLNQKIFTRFTQGQSMAVCLCGFPNYQTDKAFSVNIPFTIFFTTSCEHQYRKVQFY